MIIKVAFIRSDTFMSKIRNLYKFLTRRERLYEHVGIVIDDKIFEVREGLKSGLYPCSIKNVNSKLLHKVYEFDIDDKLMERIMKKYSNRTYDSFGFTIRVEKKFEVTNHNFTSCSLINAMLFEIGILKNPLMIRNIGRFENLVRLSYESYTRI